MNTCLYDKEVLKMTDLAEMIIEDERTIIAKRLFKNGLSIHAIAEATGLDETVIRELQMELNESLYLQ